MKNKSKSSSKSVKAPLTYDPGKGRPKEYLAYLNYQEMQALQRLNGEGPYKGPKGIPSFVLGGATTKGTAANRAMSSAAQSNKAPSTTRAPAASAAAAKASSASKGSSSVSRISGGTAGSNAARSGFSGIGGGGGGASDSGQVTARQTAARQATQSRFAESSRGTASVSRISGGTPGGNQRDAQFKAAAESRSISKAVQTPALKQDTGRSAIGGISKDKSVGLADGTRIRGAIQNIQETAAEAALRRQGPIGPTPQQYKTIEDFNRAFAQELANKQFARTGYSPQELNRLAQGVYGEAAAEGYMGMNPAARSMVNSIAGGIEVPSYSYLGGSDFDKLADRYTIFQDPNKPFKSAGVGSLNQTQGLFSLAQAASPESAFSKADDISDRIKNATHYYAQETVKPSWADKSFERYGQHTFGTADAVSENRIAAAREKIFGEPSYSTTGPVITPTSSTPERSAVPGLIQYPRLDRPMAPTAGRSAVIPTSRKPITDRIAPEYPRISSDPTMAGKDLTPRGKQIYDRIISESGDLPISIGGDVRQAFGAGAFGTGQISVPPSGIDASGSIAGSAGYSQDVIRDVYAGSVVPSRFRSATEAAASLPIAARTPSIPSMSGATSGISLLPPGVSLPSPPTMRGATSIASRFPVAAVTPSPSTMRSATDVASGFPAVNVVPSAQQSLYRGALPMGMSFTPGLPTQEKNLGVETLVDANIARNPYDVQRSVEAQTPESLVGSRQIKIDGIGTLSIEDALKTVPENKREAVRQELALAYEAGITNFSKQNFDSMVKGAEYDPNFDYSGLEAASEPDSTAVTPDGYLDPSEALPRNVSPEAQEEMRRQEKLNKTGVNVMKRAGPAGYLVSGADAGFKLFTGQGIAGNTAALKRQYMQSSPEQQAALERRYPNLTRFAKDVGLKPQLPMSNYTNWAEKSGLRGTPSREGGGPGGIASLGGGFRDDDQTGVSPTPDTPSTPSGRRPDIYYMWDLGVNIPSPGDPNYTQYQTYLAERLAAQRAMGFV